MAGRLVGTRHYMQKNLSVDVVIEVAVVEADAGAIAGADAGLAEW